MTVSVPETELTKEQRCSLPPVNPSPIQCTGFAAMWTHNPATKKCEEYVYGGCGATANLFGSEDKCKAACVDEDPRKFPFPKSFFLHALARGLAFFWYFSTVLDEIEIIDA